MAIDPKEALHASRKGVRILVADSEAITGDRLASFLRSNGFNALQAKNAGELVSALSQFQPNVIFIDLMFPELNAISLMRQLKQAKMLSEDKIKVIVMSGHNTHANVKECMKNGAADFLVKPLKPAELLVRLVFQLQKKRDLADYKPQNDPDQESALYYLYLTDAIMKEACVERPLSILLHKITQLIALATKAVRVSIVRCDLDNRRGEVLASNDKADISGLELDLVKYPEIIYVLRNEKILALDNLATDPTMHFLTKTEKSVSFHSMIVSPVKINGAVWGVLSIRMPEAKERVEDTQLRFGQAVGNLCALVVLRDANLKTLLVGSSESEAS